MRIVLSSLALLGGLCWLMAAAALMQASDGSFALDGLGTAALGLAITAGGAIALQRSLRV